MGEVKLLAGSIGVLENWFDKLYMDEVVERFGNKFDANLDSDECPKDWGPGWAQRNGVTYQKNPKRWDQSFNLLDYGSLEHDIHYFRNHIDHGAQLYFQKLLEGTGVPMNLAESPRRSVSTCIKIQRTPPGGGFNSPHYEQGPTEDVSRRYAVWMLYLNDVAHGGTTSFPLQGLEFEPKAGTLVVWPAAYTHVHHGNPPEKDCWKYIATGWYQYPATVEEDDERTRYGDAEEGSD